MVSRHADREARPGEPKFNHVTIVIVLKHVNDAARTRSGLDHVSGANPVNPLIRAVCHEHHAIRLEAEASAPTPAGLTGMIEPPRAIAKEPLDPSADVRGIAPRALGQDDLIRPAIGNRELVRDLPGHHIGSDLLSIVAVNLDTARLEDCPTLRLDGFPRCLLGHPGDAFLVIREKIRAKHLTQTGRTIPFKATALPARHRADLPGYHALASHVQHDNPQGGAL